MFAVLFSVPFAPSEHTLQVSFSTVFSCEIPYRGCWVLLVGILADDHESVQVLR